MTAFRTRFLTRTKDAAEGCAMVTTPGFPGILSSPSLLRATCPSHTVPAMVSSLFTGMVPVLLC